MDKEERKKMLFQNLQQFCMYNGLTNVTMQCVDVINKEQLQLSCGVVDPMRAIANLELHKFNFLMDTQMQSTLESVESDGKEETT